VLPRRLPEQEDRYLLCFCPPVIANLICPSHHSCPHSYDPGFSGLTHPRTCAVSAVVHRVCCLLRSSVRPCTSGLAPALLIRVLLDSDALDLLRSRSAWLSRLILSLALALLAGIGRGALYGTGERAGTCTAVCVAIQYESRAESRPSTRKRAEKRPPIAARATDASSRG
jgi:hypothetical protein